MTEARSIEEIRASARKTLTDGIARLEECIASPAGLDTILAWPHGLAVKMFDGKPAAVAIDRADSFTPSEGDFAFPVVMNGHRQTATPQMRAEAARAHLSSLRELIADLDA